MFLVKFRSGMWIKASMYNEAKRLIERNGRYYFWEDGKEDSNQYWFLESIDKNIENKSWEIVKKPRYCCKICWR